MDVRESKDCRASEKKCASLLTQLTPALHATLTACLKPTGEGSAGAAAAAAPEVCEKSESRWGRESEYALL
jgi:hypothetical protein